jgi:hypothetical protein
MTVTDTSIPYLIGDGTIKPSSFSGEQLIATYLNIRELASSYNISNGRMDKVKLAANALEEFYKFLIPIEECDYLLTNVLLDYKFDDRKWNHLV